MHRSPSSLFATRHSLSPTTRSSRGQPLRGYFAVGVDGISKPMNLGNLMRIAHAFGASFFFTVDARVRLADALSDTSCGGPPAGLPVRLHRRVAPAARLPSSVSRSPMTRSNCRVSAILSAPPMSSVRNASLCRLPMLARCQHVVRIPTRFSINVGMAGAIVLYDRMLTFGRFPDRPIRRGGPRRSRRAATGHNWGAPVMRKRPRG